ncbi:MAG: GAF domain-containing protein [Candidatus Dadabacteria bacterium]|nr:MAG: GAF domain-containing protein [Candidatus Dadabacteria bacterium]
MVKDRDSRFGYQRLLKYGNTLIMRTDADFSIVDVIGNCEGLVGLEPERIIKGGPAIWARLIYKDDIRRLTQRIREIHSAPREFIEEFRVVNQKTGKVRHFVARGVPIFSEYGVLEGWEGIGLDTTEIKKAQEELMAQKARLEALFEVARAVQTNLSPSLVALKGLKALIRATSSSSGMAFLYDEKNEELELIAADGVGSAYVAEVERRIKGPSLVRHSVTNKKGILIDDIQKDPRAAVKVAEMEGLKATIVMPLMVNESVLGAIVVFRRKAGGYSDADFELVSAAANQIALAIHKAEAYELERKQAGYFSALYRLSHELSKNLTSREISQQAIKILYQELPCKRLWLGILNEQGTHIVGQAGFGPGIRKRIVDIQIELNLEHNFLDKALEERRPVVVLPEDKLRCSGLTKILNMLKPRAFCIVPLISIGKVVGILVIEPTVGAGFFTPEKMAFLNSMAGEIATILMANRFESRMAKSDKMRMAGLFASGVAHNFNNMLQAILGQASLLEMQVDPDSNVGKAVSVIKSAAGRGASLVKQLLSFSLTEVQKKARVSIPDFLESSRDLYRSLIGSTINVEFDFRGTLPPVDIDTVQIQQVITNILLNAKEAIGDKKDGRVVISCRRVRLRSGEIDPELPPGEYVSIEIRDNGVGMDEQVVARCFEPFFTTKNTDSVTGLGVSGAGLGLSTAYSLVKQHNGLLTASSVLGEGSAFTIYLPVGKEERRGDYLPNNGTTALMVSLDNTQKVIAESALESAGMDIVSVATLSEAKRVMESCSEMKLVLVDVDLFRDDIERFVALIQTRFKSAKIILFTFSMPRWSSEFSEYDNVSILEKPVAIWALREKIYSLLGGLESDPSFRSKRSSDNSRILSVIEGGKAQGGKAK